MITFVVAPTNSPQVDALAAAGIQHPLAPEVVNALREHSHLPISLWKLINRLAASRKPDCRTKLRYLRLRYLAAFRELARAKIVFRHNGLVALRDFAFMPKRRKRARLSPTVGASASKLGGSGPTKASAERPAKCEQIPERELVRRTEATSTSSAEAESAMPTKAQVSAAASALARRPRPPKKWSGWLSDRVRSYRNMRVELPGGRQVYVYGALRGRLIYTHEQDGSAGDPDAAGISWGVVRSREVQILKNEAAVSLGKLKRGVIERKSEAKVRAARLNGSRQGGERNHTGKSHSAGRSTVSKMD